MRLTDCFIDLIAYVAYFNKKAATRQPHFDQVKANILRLLTESQARMGQGNFSQEDFDLARFAVIAWVDETILNSSWNEKDKWQREQLQRVYHQTTDAGEIFFDRLNSIGPHQRDVREVYYLCLAMGFKGRYIHEGDDYLLDQLKTSNLKVLTGSSVDIPSLKKGDLFPDAYPLSSITGSQTKSLRRFSLFNLLCLSFPLVLFLGLYLIYTFILGNVGDNLLK
jgi:type VI secretion system protein ImpK